MLHRLAIAGTRVLFFGRANGLGEARFCGCRLAPRSSQPELASQLPIIRT